MKISGFTMVRNAEKYYFPVKESIMSILPVCDELIVAVGEGEDNTRQLIESIGSDKIKIYDRVWSEQDFKESKILAKETNFALSKCTGDWCFYIQADEVVHEKDLPAIKKACEDNLNNKEVEGLIFSYNHFWGDYDHYLPFHGWYKNEIRIVRNNIGIKSWLDAQSFRKGDNNDLLKAKKINAEMFHYGWVRPPHLMQSKKKEHDSMHHGREKINAAYDLKPHEFDYGPMNKIPKFKGTHPALLADFIAKHNWKSKLNFHSNQKANRPLMKHEKFKYRFVSWIENSFFGGKEMFGYMNWKEVK